MHDASMREWTMWAAKRPPSSLKEVLSEGAVLTKLLGMTNFFGISSARPFHDTESVHGESVDWPKRVLDKVFFFHGPKWPRKWKVIGKNRREWVVGGWSYVSYRPFCK